MKNNSSFVIGNMQRFADIYDAETGVRIERELYRFLVIFLNWLVNKVCKC